MLLTLLTDNHPLLRKKSDAITTITPEIKQLAQDLILTMNYGKRAVGIAAPQVGISKRLIVCKIRNTKGQATDTVMINPQILTTSKECETGEEGCLSIPNVFGPVNRPQEITIQYIDLENRTVLKHYTHFNARVILHEIDHLEGILFTDLVTNKDELFQEVSF